MSAALDLRAHYAQVRARLRNPTHVIADNDAAEYAARIQRRTMAEAREADMAEKNNPQRQHYLTHMRQLDEATRKTQLARQARQTEQEKLRQAGEAERQLIAREKKRQENEERHRQLAEMGPPKANIGEQTRYSWAVAYVSTKHNLTRDAMLSPLRLKASLAARQELYVMLHREMGFSLSQIGRLVKRDHTTVLHGIRMHETGKGKNR